MAKTRRITICLVTALDLNLCEQIGLGRLGSDQVDSLLLDTGSRIAVIRNSSMLVR